jgi:tetrapyrrole methylase family protein/MazG family protein
MSATIVLVGLGPGSSQLWTRAAHAILTQASEVFLLHANHPSVVDIPGQTFDFEHVLNVDNADAAQTIAAEVVRLGQREQGVVFAVSGQPSAGSPVVARLQTLAAAQNIPLMRVPGLGFAEPALAAIGVDLPTNLQVVNVAALAGLHHPPLEPDRPAIITGLSDARHAKNLQQVLLNAYPDDFELWLVQGIGTATERAWRCPLAELAAQSNLAQLTTLFLPADKHAGFSTFQETIAHLRAPEGCPWDREQTHQSLRPYLLEETYEVLEALDANDPVALTEELGDLLLQIVLHTQIAIDAGEFKMGEVIDHINRKLLRRHPHVFADVVVNGVDEVTANWEAIKKAEKAANGQKPHLASALDGVPPALPALAQALTISRKAVKVGFEWPNIEGVVEKVIEEAHEIVEATDPVHLESEIGDLLFSVVNLARWRNIDPESALRSTNARFSRRFKGIEALAAAQGRSLAKMSIKEMDALWEQVKAESTSS